MSTAEAAQRLGVDTSRIRQRLAERSLYGVRTSEGWRLPAFQFLADHPVPGIGDVLPHLSPDLHPVAVHNFFMRPNVDLQGRLSPGVERLVERRPQLRTAESSARVAI